HKIIQAAVCTVSIAVRDVMKSHTDTDRAFVGRKDSHATTGLADKLKLTGVFNRHRLVEIKKPTVDMRKRMDLRTVCEVELQTNRRDARTVSCLSLKSFDAANEAARHDRPRRDSHRHRVDCPLEGERLVRGQRAAITKRREEQLAVLGFVFAQSFKDRRGL